MTIILLTCRYLILRSCTGLNILVLGVDPGYPQGAPLQVNCVAGWISCHQRILFSPLQWTFAVSPHFSRGWLTTKHKGSRFYFLTINPPWLFKGAEGIKSILFKQPLNNKLIPASCQIIRSTILYIQI